MKHNQTRSNVWKKTVKNTSNKTQVCVEKTSHLQENLQVYEPRHEKMFMPYANNKGADPPAHLCSLMSAFVVRCLDSIISNTC